jgi:T-complex protein 1 subunit theta
VCW